MSRGQFVGGHNVKAQGNILKVQTFDRTIFLVSLIFYTPLIGHEVVVLT
jgi:hypothetical protein